MLSFAPFFKVLFHLPDLPFAMLGNEVQPLIKVNASRVLTDIRTL